MKFKSVSLFTAALFLSITLFSLEARVSGNVEVTASKDFVYLQEKVGMKIPMGGHEEAAANANTGRLDSKAEQLKTKASKLVKLIKLGKIKGLEAKNLAPIETKYGLFEKGTKAAQTFETIPAHEIQTVCEGKPGYVSFDSEPTVVLRFKKIPTIASLQTIGLELSKNLAASP